MAGLGGGAPSSNRPGRGGCGEAEEEPQAQGLELLLRAVDDFCGAWFPDATEPDAVQPFWFAAGYPRQRKFFRTEAVQALRAAPRARAAGRAGLPAQPGWGVLRLCVFLDQQSRNARAVAQGPAEGKAAPDEPPGP
ncbi:unnamed protein product, partial [Prorocentrum cordatum]